MCGVSPTDCFPRPMLHPAQFEINEAWLAFKLIETPICTGLDGDFDCIALMDAASGFILGNAFAPAGTAEPPTIEVRRLLEEPVPGRNPPYLDDFEELVTE